MISNLIFCDPPNFGKFQFARVPLYILCMKEDISAQI